MGYSTRFDGSLAVEPALTPAQRGYLNLFAGTRRMRREPAATERRPDPSRLAAGLPVGLEGGYFVGAGGDLGQEDAAASPESLGILDFNVPPEGQPHLWCCWEPSPDGTSLGVPEPGYHYEYAAWLDYLRVHFLSPWGRLLKGAVRYQGDREGDRGELRASGSGLELTAEGTPGATGAAWASYERGKRHFDAEEWEPARLHLELAVSRAPRWANPAWCLGSTLWRLKDPRAFALMARAVELDPEGKAAGPRREKLAERLRQAGGA